MVINIGCRASAVGSAAKVVWTRREGTDISPEQVDIAYEAVLREVRLGDYRELLSQHIAASWVPSSSPNSWNT
jgi:hypothetical protein